MPKKTVVSEPPFVSPHGYGTCFCGCGEKAPIAPKSDKPKGVVKGYPARFVPGHQNRKYVPGYEVDPSTQCWNWTGQVDANGYARTGSRNMMHRQFYEEKVGPLVPGMHIHHTCFNRRCVNPDHLRQVSPGENTRESAKVLDWEKVRTIRARRASGETSVAIARDMGLNVYTVRSVARHDTWREPVRCPCCDHEFDPYNPST